MNYKLRPTKKHELPGPIDLEVVDDTGEVVGAVYGDDLNSIEIECEHPDPIFNGDDETAGLCELCGCYCDWHKERDFEDNTPYGDSREVENIVIDGWGYGSSSGIIGELVKDYKEAHKE